MTGAAGGIGRAIVLALAAGGSAVAAADLDGEDTGRLAEAVAERGGRALALQLDVTAPEQVRAAIERAEHELGPIGILVNCAGWDRFMPFLDSDEEFWRRVIDVNYEGTLRTTREVLAGMQERGWGRIVNIASDAARVGSAQESVYAGAKAAVIAFTKTIAREAARAGVTANVVCPGPTRTPLLEAMAAEAADSERLVAALERAVPMRRLGEPEEVAAAVAFLASEQAGYITGQTLSVSGGLTMA